MRGPGRELLWGAGGVALGCLTKCGRWRPREAAGGTTEGGAGGGGAGPTGHRRPRVWEQWTTKGQNVPLLCWPGSRLWPESQLRGLVLYPLLVRSFLRSLVRAHDSSVLQVDMYAGAIFIQQSLHLDLYLATVGLLAITALYTVTGRTEPGVLLGVGATPHSVPPDPVLAPSCSPGGSVAR